jgi:hypothetical protein
MRQDTRPFGWVPVCPRAMRRPLVLAAGQRGERLAEAEVAEPDVGELVEDLCEAGTFASPEPKNSSASVTDIASTSLMRGRRGGGPAPKPGALLLALLAGGGDPGHHRQVGVDDAGAVAVEAGALGVGAERRRLAAVGLRETPCGSGRAVRCKVAGLLRREPGSRPGRSTPHPRRRGSRSARASSCRSWRRRAGAGAGAEADDVVGDRDRRPWLVLHDEHRVALVPQRELLPEPETPVNAVSRRLGISTLTSLRLFTRAPCTRIGSWLSSLIGPEAAPGCCHRGR